ncbi:MAG: hypothetical protein UV60_C0003G0014 [Parcubacteria group bacterium GW2011_GWA2_43_11]|nr:MAG: hypothetical protein UU89_C0010G0014 [Parcubacteria group bacterium GW2011_GWC2_42_11]KKS86096.1 MAG: hypothetical protein UV60_C0003G0014 [Parcubacteria group bacterium GW2011_GWA2_43_11]
MGLTQTYAVRLVRRSYSEGGGAHAKFYETYEKYGE